MQEIVISVKPSGQYESTIEIERTLCPELVNEVVYNLLDDGYALEEILINKQDLHFHSETGNYQLEDNIWVGDRQIVEDPQA